MRATVSRGTTGSHSYGDSKKRRRGPEKPRSEWICVPVSDAGIPREQVDQARANLKGERPSRANNRFWELSGHAVCKCGCKLTTNVTHKTGKKYPYYVCSRYQRNGRGSCPDGRWLNADKLEHEIYWALRQIKPQDLEAQIQELIDKERTPEQEIKAAHEVIENVEVERDRLIRLYTTGKIDDVRYDSHAAELQSREDAARRQLEILHGSNERVERLKLIQKNPILTFVTQTPEMRRDYYKELELRVVTDKDGAVIQGIFGSQKVAPTSTSGIKR